MAVRYAVASGNWSTGSTWNGGTLPTSADDVYADGKTVTIDQSITVLSIRNQQRVGGINGGSFVVNIDNLTITADLLSGTLSTTTLTCNNNGIITIIGNCTNNTAIGVVKLNGTTTVCNLTGNIIGGVTTSAYGFFTANSTILNLTGNVTGGSVGGSSQGINAENSSTVNITGNVIGGSTSPAVYLNNISNCNLNGTVTVSAGGGGYGIHLIGTGTLTVNNSLTASGSSNYLIVNSSTGIVNINGDCLGALSTSPSTAYIVNNSGTGIVNINGSVIQRSIGPSGSVGIVNNGSTGTINISGNIGGGSVQSSIGVSNASTGTINVNGSVSGGTNATMTPAIYSTTAGIINVTGNTISNLYPAIYSTNALATHRLYGSLVSANGIFPIYGLTTPLTVRISPSNSQTIVLQDSSNVNRSFDTSNVTTGLPAASNVRKNITYGITNQYAGTMYVPTPDNVRKDVLTDNTVGTADLSVSSLIDTLTGSTNPMAVRLRNVSTTQITGSQITGLLNNP